MATRNVIAIALGGCIVTLELLERQRVKTWLRNRYATFDTLPLHG